MDARGGSFTQRWQVYAESWLGLPGNLEHWPQDVRVNGAPGAVVARNGVPSLRLAPGSYTVAGRFSWSTRPESLPLPHLTALVDLTVDNQRVVQPERPGGALWLGKRRSAEQAAAMEVQVYRLVRDEVPTYLLTRIRLNVAGDAREELLGARAARRFHAAQPRQATCPRAWNATAACACRCAPAPTTSRWWRARSTVTNTLARPDPGGQWPREEIWSFEAVDALRVAAAEGPEGIDPAQANVPREWQGFPAFRMAADSKLTVVERGRGLGNADDNRLSLHRNLWLDFDHDGFIAVDRINGSMRRDWRLDMSAPFKLESANALGAPLLVTGEDGRTGLELRTPQLSLTAVARTAAGGAMPATGWNQRFDSVSGELHLPPGHRLIAAVGADEAPDSWFERWGLWSIFGIALVVVFVYWITGLVPAAIAAVALLLIYQEMPLYIWLWGNLLAALAIARAAPEGRFRKFAQWYRTTSFVVLGWHCCPSCGRRCASRCIRSSNPSSSWSYIGAAARNSEMPLRRRRCRGLLSGIAPQDMAAPAPVMVPEEAKAESDSFEGRVREKMARGNTAFGVNSQQVVQRYASGTRLQAGPGIPAWRYNSYLYSWSGPVEAGDTVRFIYFGPVVLFFWRLIGVAALALLFLWLARLSYGGTWRLPGMPRGRAGACSAHQRFRGSGADRTGADVRVPAVRRAGSAGHRAAR